jgi:eukaryotic-like serine/threonine-protein kinase
MAAEPQGSNPSAAASALQDEKTRARARLGNTINGKWRLDSLLGVGGMASVYAATHRNGSRAALKILHSEFARDSGIRDRFLREGYVANKIDHKGRVAILDDDITESDEPFLVMELLEGETLQQLWKRKGRKVPVAEAFEITEQILDTLTSFHAQQIVHRDLKPANIFICNDGVVKLLDFGVARMREAGGDKTRAGTALGTPSFMAPEQAMGLAEGIDGRADLFSVGATLYAILSGQRLHQGRSDNEAFILAATQPAPSLARVAPDLPVEVISLVDKALAWDPRNRFESAEAMRAEVLRQLGTQAPEPAPEPARRAPRRGGGTAPEIEIHEEAPPRRRDRAPEPEPEVEAALDEGAPIVLKLIDVFRRIERLLPTVRQYGWSHPEADNKLRVAFAGLVEALREFPEDVRWTLRPYSFMHRGQSVWEPSHPLDVIPYNLFAAGVRTMKFMHGIDEGQLRSLCEVFLIDPHRDLSPEDDVGSALWERRLPHLRYEVINVFAEGDAAQREAFYEEADDLEVLARQAAEEKANRAEAAAMNVQTDGGALAAAREAASALALDPMAKRALGAQLVMSPERWSERFVDVLVDALLDAKRRGDSVLITEPLDQSVRDLVLGRRFELVFNMHDALARAIEASLPPKEARTLRAELTQGMFGPETMRILLREAIRTVNPNVLAGAQANLAPVDLEMVATGLAGVMGNLGPAHVDVVMSVISNVTHPSMRKVLFGYLERVLRGREGEVVERIMAMDVATARPLMALLAHIQSPTAQEALRRLASSPNPTIRCEATAFAAGTPEAMSVELGRLAEAPQPEIRFAALRAMAFHQVRAAGPLLVKRIQDPTFNSLVVDEKRELLGAMFALHAPRAEQLAMEIVQKHGLLVDEQLEQTRAVCAELLGERSNSMEALEAVLAATKRRWWNTQPLRDAAQVAAEAIAQRLGRRISPSGEVI